MQPFPRSRKSRQLAALVLSVVLALGAAACGSRMSDDEVRQANGVTDGSGVTQSDGGNGGNGGAEGAGAATGSTLRKSSGGSPTRSGAGSDAGSAGGATGGGSGGSTGSGTAVGTPGESGPIVIGSVGNYSGVGGSAQARIPKGVRVWAAQLNSQGGLFGRKVEVIVVDDGGDPARYRSAVQDLVENRKVVAFVGQGAFLSMQGGVSYLEEKGVPVIGGDCGGPLWFSSPVLFPPCTDVVTQILELPAAGVQTTNLKRFGYVTCVELADCKAIDDVYQQRIKETGATLVYRGEISITQIDFTSECRAARDAGVELMAIPLDNNTFSRFAQSCDRQGFRPQYVVYAVSVTADTLKIPGFDDVIAVSAVFPFAGVSGGPFDEFHGAYSRFAKETPVDQDALGWVSGKLFQLAATRAAAATRSVNPRSLLDGLRGLSGENLGGLTIPVDFTKATKTPPRCFFVLRADGGKWTAPFAATPRCL